MVVLCEYNWCVAVLRVCVYQCCVCTRLLRTDLLGLHSGCVLAAEAELRNGHVVQDDVEVLGPLKQVPSDQQRHLGRETGHSADSAPRDHDPAPSLSPPPRKHNISGI
jgi:hypothetical protein